MRNKEAKRTKEISVVTRYRLLLEIRERGLLLREVIAIEISDEAEHEIEQRTERHAHIDEIRDMAD